MTLLVKAIVHDDVAQATVVRRINLWHPFRIAQTGSICAAEPPFHEAMDRGRRLTA